MHKLALTTVFLLLLLSACSDNSVSGDVLESEDTGTSNTVDSSEPDEVIIDEVPVVGNIPNDEIFEATNSIGRSFMDDERVELFWTEVEDASNYVVYRLPTADADYSVIPDGQLEGTRIVYEGNDLEYTDTDVPVDTFLTYILIAETSEGFTNPRWTEALTTPDTTPPFPIEDLTAEVTDEGVLLQWSPSGDNLEFASYNVSYISPEGVSDFLGGGADIGQTSFIDANPREGENVYVVTASDFHQNVTERLEIAIDWPG